MQVRGTVEWNQNILIGKGATRRSEDVGEGEPLLVSVPRSHGQGGERSAECAFREPEDERGVEEADKRSDAEDGRLLASLGVRERGWRYWNNLFAPRQLLVLGLFAECGDADARGSKMAMAAHLLSVGSAADFNSKLCRWIPHLAASGGIGAFAQTFYNQALNTLFNWGVRSTSTVSTTLCSVPSSVASSGTTNHRTDVMDAREVRVDCDLWITDPPYADAVNYHELADFYLAWYEKRMSAAFADWKPDGRAALAVRGAGQEFKKSMVEVYSNLTRHMPDNGLQMVQFTHQSPAVWADLGMILWAAGLRVTAAWTVATETPAGGIKKGNYVQGTVLLLLRKRLTPEDGFLDEVYPLVEDGRTTALKRFTGFKRSSMHSGITPQP